jgi:hypothetical protein
VDPNLPSGDQIYYPPTDPTMVASPIVGVPDAGGGESDAGADAQEAASTSDAEVVD